MGAKKEDTPQPQVTHCQAFLILFITGFTIAWAFFLFTFIVGRVVNRHILYAKVRRNP